MSTSRDQTLGSNGLTRSTTTLDVLKRELLREVRRLGILGATRSVSRKLLARARAVWSPRTPEADPFDSKYGTETTMIVAAGALDVADEQLEHVSRYEAIHPRCFDGMVEQLPIEHEQFTFVDIGCGKGRALLLASRYQFRQIIGIDISRVLTNIALWNIRKFSEAIGGSDNISAACVDALTYDVPRENAVIYFYNPFDEHVMRHVLANLARSLEEFPRKVYVLYYRPVHRIVWDESKHFACVSHTERYAIYESRSTDTY
jgi:SAM-dependent methyltransferase